MLFPNSWTLPFWQSAALQTRARVWMEEDFSFVFQKKNKTRKNFQFNVFCGSYRNMCMNTFKKCMECSTDKIVIHFKLAAHKNCNVCKFIASIFFFCLLRNDEQLSFINGRDKDSCAFYSLSAAAIETKAKSITRSSDWNCANAHCWLFRGKDVGMSWIH